jgi:uncharacterized phage-associated protein
MDAKTAIEAVHYLLSKFDTCDKIKIYKLIFLADKCHLTRYGRSITHDTYFAQRHGLVGYMLKDILSFSPDVVEDNLFNEVNKFIEKIQKDTFKSKIIEGYSYFKLSKSDKDALDYVFLHFGHINQWDLSEYSHKYPEWKQYEEELKNGHKSFKIKIEELMSVLDDVKDPLYVKPEHIEMSIRRLHGIYD